MSSQSKALKEREYKRTRYQTDRNFRNRRLLKSRLYQAIKGRLSTSSTKKLLGCDLEFFKQYIQDQFSEGMSWDNYGQWHVDHKLPCAVFKLQFKTHQKKCFHYTNLQPLWAKDNLIKSAKI